MMDHYYFSGIIDEIENKTHPETHHFRKGNHPGPKWYLKTVCPTPSLNQIDKFGYGLLWANLAQQYADKIKLVPYAYDWAGDEIPYMVSVWINIDYDIIFTLDGNDGFDVVLVDRLTGRDYYLNNLEQLIRICREETRWSDNPSSTLAELDKIEEAANMIRKENHSKNAQNVRKRFEVLDGKIND